MNTFTFWTADAEHTEDQEILGWMYEVEVHTLLLEDACSLAEQLAAESLEGDTIILTLGGLGESGPWAIAFRKENGVITRTGLHIEESL